MNLMYRMINYKHSPGRTVDVLVLKNRRFVYVSSRLVHKLRKFAYPAQDL